MRKIIYLAIIERLKAAGLNIQHISLWNENITDLEQENGYGFPAVFVEFDPIKWEQRGGGVKSAPVTVRLHIVTETLADPSDGSQYQTEALEHFDTIDGIVYAVSGLAGDGFNRFQHIETIPDHNHDQIQHDVEVFTCEAKDFSGTNKKMHITATDATVSPEWKG